MKPIASHLVYRPLPGKEEELHGLMQEYMAALFKNGFTTGRAIELAYTPEGYLAEPFEWIDNNEELEEAAGNHPDIKPLRAKMMALSAIPDMKEIKRIAKELRGGR